MRPGVTLFREGTFRRELGFGAHAASNSHACRRELDPYAHVASNSRARRRVLKSGMPRPIRPWPGRGTPMNPHPTRSRFPARPPAFVARNRFNAGRSAGSQPVIGTKSASRPAHSRFRAMECCLLARNRLRVGVPVDRWGSPLRLLCNNGTGHPCSVRQNDREAPDLADRSRQLFGDFVFSCEKPGKC